MYSSGTNRARWAYIHSGSSHWGKIFTQPETDNRSAPASPRLYGRPPIPRYPWCPGNRLCLSSGAGVCSLRAQTENALSVGAQSNGTPRR